MAVYSKWAVPIRQLLQRFAIFTKNMRKHRLADRRTAMNGRALLKPLIYYGVIMDMDAVDLLIEQHRALEN